MPIKSLLLATAFATAASLAVAPVAAASPAEGPPIENFAIREVIQSVQVSPDGAKMVLLRNDSKDGDPIIEIYDTADLSKTPVRIGADPMELTSAAWVNDENIIFGARQRVRKRIRGFNQGVFRGQAVVYNLDSGKFTKFNENTGLANLLPFEPNKVILSQPRSNSQLGEDDPFAAFRPRAYYEVDLETGASSLIIKGNEAKAQFEFDDDGTPIFTRGYEPGRQEFVFYVRKPGDSGWQEYFRRSGFAHDVAFSEVGFVDPENDPSKIYVIANNGEDLSSLWIYDVDEKAFVEKVFGTDVTDVYGVRRHSNSWGRGSEIVGARYYGAKRETEWFDDTEAALYEQLEGAIPNAHSVAVTSRSRDGNTMTVFNTGPKDPGTTYLIKDGALQKIGSYNPLLTAADLSPVRYVDWEARDGRTIHGYLTEPVGMEKPYPLIVLPHGGPYVAEVIGYDEWGQFLASRGYAVLQPQYRGSLGYGYDHWRSSWFEHGGKMQDDKDDGALAMVERGIADPDRLAMFGWSYGGYAALVAASREDNIYQCSVAGAPVADLTMQYNYYKSFLRDFDKEVEDQRRSGVVPVDEVANVNIPLLFVHGSVDQRVPIEHYDVYKKAVKKAGMQDTVQFLKLDGADHFYNTLFFEHQEELYRNLERFYEEDCGPDGL